MQHTDQMRAEIESIKKYMNGLKHIWQLLRKEIYEGQLTLNSQTFIVENAKELSSCKIRLENLLCETDLKDRGR